MLSLSMIARNEEAQIGRCLASVAGFCDELLVLDTGSTDNTKSIASEAGARVETIEWPGILPCPQPGPGISAGRLGVGVGCR